MRKRRGGGKQEEGVRLRGLRTVREREREGEGAFIVKYYDKRLGIRESLFCFAV